MYQEFANIQSLGGGGGIKNSEPPSEDPPQELRNGNEAEEPPPEEPPPDDTQAEASSKPTLSPDALYGLPGRIVTTVDPYTEAAQAAVLINVLVMFGNVIGRSAYCKVEESNHYTNLYAALVGPSGSGRKGQSLST